jgi:hypothetical protein
MSKKDRLMEIIEMIEELYPELDTLMITDVENPESIIITSGDRVAEAAEQLGYEPEDLQDDEDSLDQYLAKIGFDDDDDGGGMMQ